MQWRIQLLKKKGALTQHFQINIFWSEFYIKKVTFVGKKGGARSPAPPSKSATGVDYS